MDDIVIVNKNADSVTTLKVLLDRMFKPNDLRELQYLGLKLLKKKGTSPSYTKYALEVLEAAGHVGVKQPKHLWNRISS